MSENNGPEQKSQSPEARGEQSNSTKAPTNDNNTASREARGREAKSAAAAYVRQCEAEVAQKFSGSGTKSVKGKKGGY